MPLIGLYGDSRCGKDTVAGILKKYGYEQRVMADPIREMLLKIDPIIAVGREWDYSTLSDEFKYYKGDWDKIKAAVPYATDLMIALGQAARDIIAEDVWLAPVMRNLPSRTVISDIRQPNEYEAVKLFGGEVWHIIRPGTVPRGMDRLLDGYKFDAIIENDSTLTELAIKIDHHLWRSRDPEACSEN